MLESPQTIRVTRAGLRHTAVIAWVHESGAWSVTTTAAAFGTVDAQANDAFEALCLVRAQLEPYDWRLGVAGAQIDVWPSGMARDQGGGLRAYRITPQGAGDLVDTFEPVDPDTVTTVVEQRAAADRWFEEMRRGR